MSSFCGVLASLPTPITAGLFCLFLFASMLTARAALQGCEVVRMYDTILGKEGFRKGLDLYFKRHDGSAVTCDDFLAAMADANGEDLASLGKWCAPRFCRCRFSCPCMQRVRA